MQALLLSLALALVVRLLWLQVMPVDRGYEYLQDAGDARSVRTVKTNAYRGMITDRNGRPLAVSTPVESIWVNPQQFDLDKDISPLAVLLGISEDRLRQKIEKNAKKEFIYLKRQISPEAAQKAMALGYLGVDSITEYKRFYPEAEVTAHLLGFTDRDERGVEGLELAYDRWLKGENGSQKVLKDRKGRTIQHISSVSDVKHGKDLQLSIDLRLQYVAYRQLKSAMKTFKARSGSVVVLDVQSNEVLAMVNQPSYNPNYRVTLSPSAMRNRAMTDMVEPGSTIKPLSVVAALESGLYRPNSVVDTSPGYINVEGKLLADHANYGKLDLAGVLKKSSQVGISKIALSLEDGAVRNVLQRVGLGETPATGFPGESAGLLPDYTRWHPLHTVTMAYGYGVAVTPLQLAQAYSVLANHGIRKDTSLIKRDVKAEGRRVIDEKIATQVATMMTQATQQGGTATRAVIDQYTVSGKTGTSHRLGAKGYEESSYISVFAGFVPADNPRLVAAVVIDDPQGEAYYGGEVAAPIFSDVVGESLRLLNIRPESTRLAGAQ